jgi:predicted metal-binding membrane protein
LTEELEQGPLDFILRRDRMVVSVCLLIVSAGAWLYIWSGAGMGMSMWEMTHPPETGMGMGMDMNMVMPQVWSFGYAVVMFFMWWIMMIAMMLPSATPTILLSAALNRRSSGATPPYGNAAVFTLGYLLAWALFSMAAVLAHWLLEQAGVLSMLMESASRTLSGLLLILAGGWQFTPFKNSCLTHCQSPVQFLVRNRRPGNRGALLMGLHHGGYCLGCCWFLMALLFVGGVMNLYWIIGLAIYVYLEKLPAGGKWLTRISGAGLLLWGSLVLTGLL